MFRRHLVVKKERMLPKIVYEEAMMTENTKLVVRLWVWFFSVGFSLSFNRYVCINESLLMKLLE